MKVDSKLNTTVTMTTMTTLMYPLLQDPQARCNVPLLHVCVQVCSLVWACLCLKFYWMFYLEIKSTLVIWWSIFIPLKINNSMNNIYQLVLITCAILSLSSWPLIPLTTIPKSEKIPISETCLVPKVSDKRLCTCIITYSRGLQPAARMSFFSFFRYIRVIFIIIKTMKFQKRIW
jgi:hypothetical protein